MLTQIQLDDVVVDVVHKRVKYLRLSVHPPIGQVRISAPLRMGAETIRRFVVSKRDWIRQQQEKLQSRQPHVPCAYLDDEIHMVWGRECVLKVVATDGRPFVELADQTLLLHIHSESSVVEREELVRAWHRTLLQATAPALVARWEPILRVARRAGLSASHDDAMGKLYAAVSSDPPQYGTGKEAAGVPRVRRRARDGSSAGSQPQQAICATDGSVHARLATASAGAESLRASCVLESDLRLLYIPRTTKARRARGLRKKRSFASSWFELARCFRLESDSRSTSGFRGDLSLDRSREASRAPRARSDP